MTDLFDYAETYPHAPGHRGVSSSIEAADVVKPSVPYLQGKVLEYLRVNGPSTTREIARGLSVDYASIQPRTSELRKMNKLSDSGQRRKEGRVSVIVWRAV